MAIPKYNELYGTFLECLKDGNVHTLKEIKDAVIKEFNLTEEDIQEMLPSGRQRVYENRIGWCRQYLKKANCITTPARAQFLITARGQNLLSQKININDDVLMQFPEFAAYKGEKCQKETATNDDITQLNSVEDEGTPQEILDHAYEEVNDALAVELLDEVRNMDPYKFEQLVVDLLIKM